jgi:hypothetical protein
MRIGAVVICERRVAGSSGWPELSSCTSIPPKSTAEKPWSTDTLPPNRSLRPYRVATW